MLAALGLGSYSYRSAAELARVSKQSVERSNRALGLKLIDRIEKVIIDTDRTFFRLVRLDDPREFRELWRRIVRVSPEVESVIVLNEERELVHLIAKLNRKDRRKFREMLMQRIVPDLDLANLPPDKHKHLQTKYEGKPYLLSYIRRRLAGRDYVIVLNMHLPYLISDIFREEFHELEDSTAIAVMEQEGGVIYGQPVAADSAFVFEERFPTTLYKWRLQIAPRQVSSLAREVRARKVSDGVLVGGAVGVIWIGMGVLLIAVRKERRLNQLKSDFISNVSHELKTPLSLIRMFGELLALGRAPDPETRKEYAEIITRESDRLTSLIDNVLDFARIERGKAEYSMEPGDLRAVVERVIELSRYRGEQAGVTISPDLPDTVPITVFDQSAMTLVLLNLVENALKYGSKSGDEINVRLSHMNDELVVEVADHGEGIPPEEIRRIFERFYRGSTAQHAGRRGSGIGLSLVKHIAEAHGGRITVNSDDKGTAFQIALPVRSVA